MTLFVDRYLTNLYGPDTLVALVALSNATPRSVIVSGGPGSPLSRAGIRFDHLALPQSIYLAPHQTSDVFEMRGPGRTSLKYLTFDLSPTKSVVERLQFWMDRHLLHCDRRTNIYTLHFDIP